MDQAVTVGAVVWVLLALGGCALVLWVLFKVLEAFASGWNH